MKSGALVSPPNIYPPWIPEKKNSAILTFRSNWLTYSKVERYKLSREALRSEFITTNTKDWLSVKTIADVPDGTNLSSHLLGMIANHRRNPGCVGKKSLFPTILDDRRHLRFRVFVSGQSLGRSGNSKIHERLEFSRHINTRFKQAKKIFA